MNHKQQLKALKSEHDRQKRRGLSTSETENKMKFVFNSIDRQCRVSGLWIESFIDDRKLLRFLRKL